MHFRGTILVASKYCGSSLPRLHQERKLDWHCNLPRSEVIFLYTFPARNFKLDGRIFFMPWPMGHFRQGHEEQAIPSNLESCRSTRSLTSKTHVRLKQCPAAQPGLTTLWRPLESTRRSACQRAAVSHVASLINFALSHVLQRTRQVILPCGHFSNVSNFRERISPCKFVLRLPAPKSFPQQGLQLNRSWEAICPSW